MSQRVLICGSLAFDSIMVFPGQFQDHFLPNSQQSVNAVFEVEQLRREFGGCGGNIAYSFQALGGKSVVMGTLGLDGAIYLDRMNEWGCDTHHVRVLSDTYTAQAFITTDRHSNQIVAFYPGAMNECHINHVYSAPDDIALAIVAPQGYEGMKQHVYECFERRLPCLFDPGQGLPLFSAEPLLETISQSTWLIVNDYESKLLEKILGMNVREIASLVEALIITRAADGSEIHFKNGEILIVPAVQTHRAVDPTGCGDAYRAGLMYGLIHGWSWLKTARLASLLGSIKIEVHGGQNHTIEPDDLAQRYETLFHEPLWG
ncbi:MAG: carbohydrate kinase family protein [Pseudomonadota bacterium]